MSIKYNQTASGQILVKITGVFNYGLHKEFREMLRSVVDNGISKAVIDMTSVDDMDSSALGMLLLLRESLGGDPAAIEITNCSKGLREMIEIANFHTMFMLK